MALNITIKDLDLETRLIYQRIYLASAFVLLVTLLIVTRIFYLQVTQHEHFTTLSQSNRIKILPAPPARGLIFSSDQVLLADNRPTFTLEVVPEQVDELDSTIKRLSEIIAIEPGDIRRFKELQKKKRRFEGIPLKFNLSDEEVALISVNRHLFPGVDVATRLNRHYPLGRDLSHTIGYVGMIDEAEFEKLNKSNYSGITHIGKSGVEKAYESLLHGYVGYRQVEVNAQGRKIREIGRKPPEPGKNLYLTLDASLQTFVAQSLEGKRGAIVAIEPATGAILASVSSPGYDPNLFVNGIDKASYNELIQSKATPLLNRFLRGKYPPGSTIKPFLGLGALQHRVRDSVDETWCRGWYSLKGSTHRYRDWKKEGHGHMDLLNAVSQSCDVYFYSLAHDLGIEGIHQSLTDFGFGKPTNIDIGNESAGLVPSKQWKKEKLGQPWYPGETLITGIGQGAVLVTPIQLAAATAAMANRGRLVRPYLLSEVRDSITGQLMIRTTVREDRQLVSAGDEHWDTIIESMREVVHGNRGTARATGAGSEYEFAGKTGTAQVITIAQDEEYKEEEVPEEFRDHALFIAFAPIERPEIAVAIIVENGGSGSSTAAPIARALFDHYLGTPGQVRVSSN